MKIYDVSVPISEDMVVWRGGEPPRIKFVSNVNKGDRHTESEMTLRTHIGTHVDAPLHFVKGGATVDQLDLNVLVGPAQVYEALEADALTAAVFEALNIAPGTERV